MNSLPFISHHLFVAATAQETPGRRKPSPDVIVAAAGPELDREFPLEALSSGSAAMPKSYQRSLPLAAENS